MKKITSANQNLSDKAQYISTAKELHQNLINQGHDMAAYHCELLLEELKRIPKSS